MADGEGEKPKESSNAVRWVVSKACDLGRGVTGGFFRGIDVLRPELSMIKYGPFNWYMKDDPDYLQALKKWDAHYEKHARDYGILPDWGPFVYINDLKSLWHQVQFLRWENHFVSQVYSQIPNGHNSERAYKSFTPHSWDIFARYFCFLDHHRTLSHTASIQTAEANIADRHTSTVIDRPLRMEYETWHYMADDVAGAGIRPKLLTTEDFGYHGNGYHYVLQATRWQGYQMPTFRDKEHEKAWMGRFFAYKEHTFGKRLIGHATEPEADRYIVPGHYYLPPNVKPAEH